MGLYFSIDNRPHRPLVKVSFFAKLRKIDTLFKVALRVLNFKRALFSPRGYFPLFLCSLFSFKWVIFFCPSKAIIHPPLLGAVSHVFCLTSKKEVLWINTRRVVTFVTNVHSFIKCAIVNFIGKSMRSKFYAGLSVFPIPKVAIPAPALCAVPNPTVFGFNNLFPESLLKCFSFHSDRISRAISKSTPIYNYKVK